MVPTLQQFFDSYGVVATSSVTHGTKEAHHAYASVITSTQVKSLRTLLNKSDEASGFLNRWLFVPGTEKRKVAIGGATIDITPAVKPLEAIYGWAGSFGTGELMQWSEKAASLYTQFFHDTIEPDKKSSQHDMIARIDLMMKKIIMLLSANLMHKDVPEQAVQDAIEMYPYLLDSLNLIAGEVGTSTTTEIATKIERLVRDTVRFPRGPSQSEIYRALKGSRYELRDIVNTLDLMAKLSFIDSVNTNAGRPGRPSYRFRWNES